MTSPWARTMALGAMSLLATVTQHALAAQATLPISTDAQTVSDLRRQIDDMRRQYETRLKELEARLDQVQQAQTGTANAVPATPVADGTGTTASTANGFNPMVSVILSGTYASLSKDPGTWQLSGFIPGGDEIGPGQRGFSLGESELTLSANIDPWWYGALTLAVSPEDTISAEEAFVQTTALPAGLKLKVGRFFSGLGYLNEQHAHTWDFVDAPLAYQAFLGGQYKQEGVQLKWLAPTDQFIELGAELGNGHSFPGNDRNRNSAGAASLFAHTGGDLGDSHSWRAGLSWLNTKAQDRAWDAVDAADQTVSNAFTGNSRMWVADAVWKWAPNGNGKVTNFKLQGEYFRRTESGEVVYDTGNAATPGDYRSAQSGWYLQGIYQFTTGWRVGLRHDELDSGTVDYGLNTPSLVLTDYKPKRDSLMLDWSPSEFSRWRLQVSNDRSREGINDRQLFLQYQMSLGAHGAHSY
ncbi:MAG TPA: TonB-dependent receptor [Aquabacterium sp.]|uniref:TonB-dependent receptor n=1 Tax=Aquabacterium sp. TaxID=1872578 RepID=UPI002E3153DB|nr:TonB-dependent receptor [Aquabacterium sp.]HEX5356114.1 TonB-dependent receptor [Aquabacterium sp.]